MFRSKVILLSPPPISYHWNRLNQALTIVGCIKNIIDTDVTIIFLLRSLTHFIQTSFSIIHISIANIIRAKGKIPVRNILKNEADGVNNFSSLFLKKQSNDTKDSEELPILSMGVNIVVNIFGNLRLNARATAIICK